MVSVSVVEFSSVPVGMVVFVVGSSSLDCVDGSGSSGLLSLGMVPALEELSGLVVWGFVTSGTVVSEIVLTGAVLSGFVTSEL